MNWITAKEMITFLSENADILDTYDVSPVYKKAIRAKAKHEYGIYVDESNIDTRISYRENLDNFIAEKIVPKYGSVASYKFYQDFQYCAGNMYGVEVKETKADKIVSVKAHETQLYALMYVLRYVIDEKIDDDLKEANEIQAASNLPYNIDSWQYTDFSQYGLPGENIQVKRQVNGTILIKGLTDEMIDRLKDVVTIVHK